MSKTNIPKLKYIVVPDEDNVDKLNEIKQIIAQSLVDLYNKQNKHNN